jgi:glyoxylase-like metal-dependent hydrolase (beta-lactamase superfamily II)
MREGRQKMTDAKLYVLSNGRMWIEKGFVYLYGGKEDSGKPYEPKALEISNSSYFIDHPKAKILFDLGWTVEDFGQPLFQGFPMRANEEGLTIKQAPDENPKSQLEKIGVSIDDIDYVVISHLFVDHDGWLPLFRGKKARIIVQRREFEYAYSHLNPKTALEPYMSWLYWKDHFDHPDLNYELIEGDHFLVEDVEIIFTPGHSPGYQRMKVKLEESGTIILSSCEFKHMYYGYGLYADAPGIPHTWSYCHPEELRGHRRILEIAKRENAQIFFGHEMEQFESLKKVPEFYA